MSTAQQADEKADDRAARRARIKAMPRRDRYAVETRRIWVSLAIMLAVSFVAAVPFNIVFDTLRDDPRAYYVGSYMIFWVIFVLLYAIFTLWALRRRERTEFERVIRGSRPKKRTTVLRWLTDGGGAVSWTVSVSVLSVMFIVILWTNEGFRGSVVLTLAGGAVVATSWFMMVISYAVQYAREDVDRQGLEFAGSEPPVFDDYLYLAITVSASLAVSDTTVTTTQMRRLVRSHTLVGFAFNTVIVALLVSLLTIAVG